MKSFTLCSAFVSVLALVLLWLPTAPAHAYIFTQNELDDQKEVVTNELTQTMEEQLKLLQMIFINLLDERLEQLERQANK